MADEIKLKAPTVEQQVVVNINGEDKLKSFADTLDKISNNKNLQKYWKTQQDLINATADAYSNFQRKASKDNASELIKVTNALKAMSGTDLSNILPDFDKISKSMIKAQKIAGDIDSAFSVKGFKEAFDSFETLKAYGTDIQKLFSHFGVNSDIGELQQNVRLLEGEVEKLTKRLSNARNANEELRNEFENFKVGSGFADKLDELDRLKAEMQNIRNEATQTFNQFLDANKIDRYNWFNDDRFAEYFEKLENGTFTASEAIRQFKTEYDYLLEESFKSNGNSFGLDQLQAFSTKLDSIFHQVEETSNKINDILSNGVIAKSVQNLSKDTALSDSQRSIFGNILQDEESLKSITALFQKLIDETNQTKNTEVFNTEQFTKIESLFTSIESSLSSIKGVLVDVGDGEELSPLLKTINNIEVAVNKLSSSVKNIGLNMNIDIGSDKEMEAKAQAKIANALQAYQRLFDHLKVTAPAGEIIGQKFFDFDISQYDTTRGKLEAYVKFIKDIRNEAKSYFNGQDVLYTGSDKKYWTQASSAAGQVTKVFNEIKAASNTNPLENLFGKTDLTPIISQLENIAVKLDEISVSTTRFSETFSQGVNVTTSVEEVSRLTEKVKELEVELAKVKITPATLPTETNILSAPTFAVQQQDELQEGLKRTELQAVKTEQALKEAIISTASTESMKDAFQGSSTKAEASANAINKENEALKQTANTATEAATAKEKFTKANSKVKESADASVGSVNQEAEALANAGKSAESGLNSIDEANRRIESLKKSFKDLENTNGFRKVNQEFEEAVNSITDSSSLKDYRNTIEQLRKLLSEAKKINTESNSALNRVNNQFENLSNSDVLKSTFSKQLAESSLIIDELNAKFKNGTISIDEYNTKTRQTLSNLAELKRLGNGQILGSVNSVTTIDAAKQQVLNYASQNSKKISKPINVSAPDSNGIRTITTEIITQENEIQKLTAKWSAATNTVSLSTKTMGTEVSATTKVIQGFVNKWKQLAQYMTAMYLNPYMLIYRIRDMITTVSELDYELMDLRKTADMSTSELHEFYLESNNVAKEMGVSTKEILSQASAWSRLGYNTKQTATEMAKLSSQFATISPGMEVDEATTGLVSVMKAFDITTDEVKSEIMDKINIVGNNFATNNQEIIEGLQRMASAMASTGADLEDTIALFTAGQEVVQDAEQVGSAIKSFSMRIRGMEETGEYLDELKDIKGDVYELTNGKVHIMEDENTYRPVLDILRDISEVWSEITDKNRAKLLEKLFAKTRANVGAAVLQNFQQAEKSLEVMENSAGSSDKEMSIAQDTLDYKINKLKGTWTGFLQEIADQKTTGGVIDFFTAVSDVITNIVSGLGLLKTTVISVFAVIAAKNNLGRANYISSPSYCLNVSRV